MIGVTPHSAPVTAVFLDTPVDVKGGLVRQHIFSASRDGLIRRLGLVASQENCESDQRRMKLVKVHFKSHCMFCNFSKVTKPAVRLKMNILKLPFIGSFG